MRMNDAVTGAILILFAIAVILHAQTFPRLHGQDYGPDLFPTIIASGLILCGALLIGKGWAARREGRLVLLGPWARDRRMRLNVALLVAGVVAYILFANFIGFIPLSFIILAVLTVRLGAGPLAGLATAAAATLVIHTIFAKLLLVPLPWGLLLPIAW